MNECDHIVGYEFYIYQGWWPAVKSDGWDGAADHADAFNYCPICGEKLEKE